MGIYLHRLVARLAPWLQRAGQAAAASSASQSRCASGASALRSNEIGAPVSLTRGDAAIRLAAAGRCCEA